VVLLEVLVSQRTDDRHCVFIILNELFKFHLDLVGFQRALKLAGNLAVLIALLGDLLIINVHEQRLLVLFSQLFPLKTRIPQQFAIEKLIVAFLNNVELSHTCFERDLPPVELFRSLGQLSVPVPFFIKLFDHLLLV
jgi:hypothetical protein